MTELGFVWGTFIVGEDDIKFREVGKPQSATVEGFAVGGIHNAICVS